MIAAPVRDATHLALPVDGFILLKPFEVRFARMKTHGAHAVGLSDWTVIN